MKKRNGFTLIELLAVIVILAIIALIAVPIILNIIGDAKSSSNERSIELYADAVEKSVATYQLNNNEKISGTFTTEDGKTLTSGTTTLKVDYKGKVVCETIEIYEDGKIYLADCKVNDTEVKDYTYGKSNNSVPTPVSFKDDSWETIVANVRAGNTSAYNVGDTKEISLTGFTNKETDSDGKYTIRIANTSTPSECKTTGFSQTACGFVIEFEDIISTHNMNATSTNAGGYPASSMYTYIQNDIYNALPEDLKSVIIPTYVVSGHGSTSGEKNFVTEQDKLYLLSGKEVYGSDSYDTSSDLTRQLEYYSNLKVTTSSYSGAIKKRNGTATYWWLRSASSNYTYFFRSVDSNGNLSNYGPTYAFGVAVAFRIG